MIRSERLGGLPVLQSIDKVEMGGPLILAGAISVILFESNFARESPPVPFSKMIIQKAQICGALSDYGFLAIPLYSNIVFLFPDKKPDLGRWHCLCITPYNFRITVSR
jgi:hypothetical protein